MGARGRARRTGQDVRRAVSKRVGCCSDNSTLRNSTQKQAKTGGSPRSGRTLAATPPSARCSHLNARHLPRGSEIDRLPCAVTIGLGSQLLGGIRIFTQRQESGREKSRRRWRLHHEKPLLQSISPNHTPRASQRRSVAGASDDGPGVPSRLLCCTRTAPYIVR